jgi:hypothetical protein
MMYVKCVYDGCDGDVSRRLCIGRIYKVLNITDSTDNGLSPIVNIIDDLGHDSSYIMTGSEGKIWFIDATSDIREEKLNKILK